MTSTRPAGAAIAEKVLMKHAAAIDLDDPAATDAQSPAAPPSDCAVQHDVPPRSRESALASTRRKATAEWLRRLRSVILMRQSCAWMTASSTRGLFGRAGATARA
eukprot:Amastigsp_a841672_193.p2 type:complete len:105 gc:universal Amastigsp_a841672_193:753-439(-)